MEVAYVLKIVFLSSNRIHGTTKKKGENVYSIPRKPMLLSETSAVLYEVSF
jgi:hypothetical protein